MARFSELAATGVDVHFGRGERAVQQLFNGDVREEPGRANPTMWPLAADGPYYAALVTGGTLDTKGGPKCNVDGQVLDDMDQPISGLYGVGNCVASASRRAGVPEWGAGRWCDVFEIRDWLIHRCFIYLDPDYAGQDTGRYPWLAPTREGVAA